ncbi:hypothetical protein LHJ74_13850 [Streptomyces sp. N2-109]|uniref:Uncharacterized protein n=1 Tax=Streptomyces gossypii TaxID=2883101 RepID=A0ABT2JUE0_9ACTN|nr:hypothetical protein [Streptomyces gossypii]MCT2590980.1 hypothetical protein [Streptomyces gossypii]
MREDLSRVREIVLPRPLYSHVIAHAVRKFTDHYLEGETREHKAFGMLAGRPSGAVVEVRAVFPLISNLRHEGAVRRQMDKVVGAHAIPSQTPDGLRGWVADPRELLDIERACDDTDWLLFGNYHTHRVAWEHDALRDTCTELDRVLARDSRQWTFILSAVDLRRPRLRAFFEGDNSREASVRVLPVTPWRPPGSSDSLQQRSTS